MLPAQVIQNHARHQVHAGPVLFDKVADQANARFPDRCLGHACNTGLALSDGATHFLTYQDAENPFYFHEQRAWAPRYIGDTRAINDIGSPRRADFTLLGPFSILIRRSSER